MTSPGATPTGRDVAHQCLRSPAARACHGAGFPSPPVAPVKVQSSPRASALATRSGSLSRRAMAPRSPTAKGCRSARRTARSTRSGRWSRSAGRRAPAGRLAAGVAPADMPDRGGAGVGPAGDRRDALSGDQLEGGDHDQGDYEQRQRREPDVLPRQPRQPLAPADRRRRHDRLVELLARFGEPLVGVVEVAVLGRGVVGPRRPEHLRLCDADLLGRVLLRLRQPALARRQTLGEHRAADGHHETADRGTEDGAGRPERREQHRRGHGSQGSRNRPDPVDLDLFRCVRVVGHHGPVCREPAGPGRRARRTCQ